MNHEDEINNQIARLLKIGDYADNALFCMFVMTLLLGIFGLLTISNICISAVLIILSVIVRTRCSIKIARLMYESSDYRDEENL